MPRKVHDPFAASRIQATERPAPPDYLPDDVAEEWVKVVERMPPNWFPRETHAMLEQRCRHVITMRMTNRMLEELMKRKRVDVKEYNFLVRLMAGQARTLMSYDSNMRLTQQSSFDRTKKKGSVATTKTPWQEAAE